MDNQRQTTEVRETQPLDNSVTTSRQTVDQQTTVPGNVLARRVVWYIVGFIATLLALRVLLLLLGANQDNAFVGLIYAISGIFAMPFYGIFNYQPAYGQSVFEISSVIAILIYLLIGWGVAKLFTLGSSNPAV